MICPTCHGTMAHMKDYVTHGDDGTAYDAAQYRCSNDDNFLTWETPQAVA